LREFAAYDEEIEYLVAASGRETGKNAQVDPTGIVEFAARDT
jgi:hypothetical protein